MKSVKGIVTLKKVDGKVDLFHKAYAVTIAQMIHFFVKNIHEFELMDFEYEIKPTYIKWSGKQMGYYRSEILPKARKGYHDMGWVGISEFQTEHKLKTLFFHETVVNEETGELERIPLLFRDASKMQMIEFMSNVILHVEEDLKQEVVTPEKYKEEMRKLHKFRKT